MVEIERIWLTDDAVWIRTKDGREARELFIDFPRLADADKDALSSFVADEYGISWPDLDEDLSYEGFFDSRHINDLHEFFKSHPELNVSAIARRMGISQSLFAQYISGMKKPSAERLNAILSTIQEIGRELVDAHRTFYTKH